jgi:hypothetical protein
MRLRRTLDFVGAALNGAIFDADRCGHRRLENQAR